MVKGDSGEITDILLNVFPGLAEPELQREIAQLGKIYEYQAGDIIMNFGSYVKLVPLIIEGSIKVTREDELTGREMLLYFIGAGETCSMSFTCCMMQKKSAIRTEALDATKLIGIPVRHVDAWMTKYQSWKNFVMRTYDEKMVDLVRVLDSIAFEGLDTRLIKYLHARADSINATSISTTHQEIADDLGASREAISRLLKKLESKNQVALGRNTVVLKGTKE